ncbi:MAG: hypothetical protein ACLUVD_05165 [Mediterraneibacter faecis]
MAQKSLKIRTYTPPDVDEDGYQISMSTTSTENSGRTMRGNMKNSPLFTIEAYELKWSDIKVSDASKISKRLWERADSTSFTLIFTRIDGKPKDFTQQTLMLHVSV